MSKTNSIDKKKVSTAIHKNRLSKKSKNNLLLVSAFFIPFLLMGTAFAYNGVYPFGDSQILVTDLWQQYYPFLSDFHSKLQSGDSLLYSWGVGLGTNYIALMAYYLASPLNFLTVLVPSEFLREALTLSLLIKVGCAGLFTTFFLRYSFKKLDVTTVFFSSLFALCSFTMGYYWNVIWMDTFALFPLVVMGTVALIREGKFRLYVISLALAILTNYYIGLFVCVFTVFVFFSVCICRKLALKEFFKKLGQIVLCSIVSVMFSAFVTLPAYYNLQITQSSVNNFPTTWRTENPFTDVIGNFTALNVPNVKEGLPNVYAGFICIVLIGIYLLAKNISVREKLCSIVVLTFILVSTNINVLDYIWHGMHETNMIPYRFSFLISFIIVVLAYRALMVIDQINIVDIIFMAMISGAVLFCYTVNGDDTIIIVGNIIIAVFIISSVFLYNKKVFNKATLNFLICFVILAELTASAFIGVNEVRVTSRSTYPDQLATIQQAVEEVDTIDDEEFYRSEFTKFYTTNDPALYGYYGVSMFSSTINVNVSNFMYGIGELGWDAGNRYLFAESTPLTHAFLDVKYLMAKNGHISDTYHWKPFTTTGYLQTYKNTHYLSLGFMTDRELLNYESVYDNSFVSQQNLFEKSTGVTDDLFTMVDVYQAGHVNANVYYSGETQTYGQYTFAPVDTTLETELVWTYSMPEDGTLYAYPDIDHIETISAGKEGDTAVSYSAGRPYLISVGEFKKGDIIKFSAKPTTGNSGTAHMYVGMLNEDVFQEGYDILNDEKLEITSFETTNIKGKINVKEDGLLYTSIPYESGWSAYVDGQEVEVLNIAEAMCAIDLTKGVHEVEFRYSPAGFVTGVILFVVALGIFILMIFLSKRFEKKKVLVGTTLEETESVIEETQLKEDLSSVEKEDKIEDIKEETEEKPTDDNL